MVVADDEVLARVGRDAVLGAEAPVEVDAVVVAVLPAVVEPDAVTVVCCVSFYPYQSGMLYSPPVQRHWFEPSILMM